MQTAHWPLSRLAKSRVTLWWLRPRRPLERGPSRHTRLCFMAGRRATRIASFCSRILNRRAAGMSYGEEGSSQSQTSDDGDDDGDEEEEGSSDILTSEMRFVPSCQAP